MQKDPWCLQKRTSGQAKKYTVQWTGSTDRNRCQAILV